MKRILIMLILLVWSNLFSQKFDLAKTPPMGWNSWNAFHCEITESLVKQAADEMISSGMKDAGYEYLVIDDCWQVDRDAFGNVVADPVKFPSGIKALVDYVHSKGLKFGIYSDAGDKTCQGRPGSRGYEYQDARQYAEWGVDYLKYDWCNHHEKQNAESSYALMRDAIYKAGRPVVFSICEWGSSKPWEWGANVGHLWRATGDIVNCFDCNHYWGLGVIQILDLQKDIRQYSGPGHWNDMDMLQIGNGAMTQNEEKAHFSLWCMMSSPLMAGNDLKKMSKATQEILTNKELIAVDQDSIGFAAIRIFSDGNLEVWLKPMSKNTSVFVYFNRGKNNILIDENIKKHFIGFISNSYIDDSFTIRDLWKHKDIGLVKDNVKFDLQSHDVLVLKAYKK